MALPQVLLLLAFFSFDYAVVAQTGCPPETVCEFEKCMSRGDHSTCCRCFAWRTDGVCTPTGWRRVNGTGTCDFDVDDPAPGSCLPGIECDAVKCSNRDDDNTCCDCDEWNPDGTCTARGWKPRVEGHQCDFEVPRSAGGVFAQPKQSPETFSPFRAVGLPASDETEGIPASEAVLENTASVKLPPCPVGEACDTVRCAAVHGEHVCCECLKRRANGDCFSKGWFLLDNPETPCPLTSP